jgi:hypothetical protein
MTQNPKLPKSQVGASAASALTALVEVPSSMSRREKSGKRAASKAGGRLKSVSWMLRTQRSAVDPLRTFSKYTPAKPEAAHMDISGRVIE